MIHEHVQLGQQLCHLMTVNKIVYNITISVFKTATCMYACILVLVYMLPKKKLKLKHRNDIKIMIRTDIFKVI